MKDSSYLEELRKKLKFWDGVAIRFVMIVLGTEIVLLLCGMEDEHSTISRACVAALLSASMFIFFCTLRGESLYRRIQRELGK